MGRVCNGRVIKVLGLKTAQYPILELILDAPDRVTKLAIGGAPGDPFAIRCQVPVPYTQPILLRGRPEVGTVAKGVEATQKAAAATWKCGKTCRIGCSKVCI